MKKIITLLAILLFSTAFSQNFNFKIDSLNRVLQQVKKPIEQMKALGSICSYYGHMGQTDSLKVKSKQMLKIAIELHQDSLLAIAYLQIGNYFHTISDYKQSLEFELKGLAFAEKSKNISGIWLGTKEVGIIFKELKNYPEALKYLKRSELFLSQKLENRNISSNRTYTHLAETYLLIGRTDTALRYVQLANEVTDKKNDAYGYARVLYIFAGVYKVKEDTDLAENYFKKCISFSDTEKILLPFITASTDYGQFLFEKKQFTLSK